ncbi:MAG: hypothetical protein LBF69_01045 [Prevotellaceae bacterium]|jgi:hypothetical protein|nr:hypothetical protein [Prevotellaceae bacterium]
MKKVMKSFMAIALGLSLVLAGCSKDDEDAVISFEGDYEATAIVTGAPTDVPSIPTTVTLTKEGANYRASATLSAFGSLSLLLTSVTEKANAGGVVSYDFVVAEQTLTILGSPLPVSGSGTLGSAAGKYTITMNLTVEEYGITVVITGSK